MDLEWCKDPDRGLLKPDAVLFLHLSVDEALKRGNFGVERYEKEAFQRLVAARFAELREPDWTLIEANQSETALAEAVRNAVVPLVGNLVALKTLTL